MRSSRSPCPECPVSPQAIPGVAVITCGPPCVILMWKVRGPIDVFGTKNAVVNCGKLRLTLTELSVELPAAPSCAVVRVSGNAPTPGSGGWMTWVQVAEVSTPASAATPSRSASARAESTRIRIAASAPRPSCARVRLRVKEKRRPRGPRGSRPSPCTRAAPPSGARARAAAPRRCARPTRARG